MRSDSFKTRDVPKLLFTQSFINIEHNYFNQHVGEIENIEHNYFESNILDKSET